MLRTEKPGSNPFVIAFFDSVGCVVSDHALDVVMYEPATKEEVGLLMTKTQDAGKEEA